MIRGYLMKMGDGSHWNKQSKRVDVFRLSAGRKNYYKLQKFLIICLTAG